MFSVEHHFEMKTFQIDFLVLNTVLVTTNILPGTLKLKHESISCPNIDHWKPMFDQSADKHWCHHPFTIKFRLSSFFLKIEVVSFHLLKYWGRLPFGVLLSILKAWPVCLSVYLSIYLSIYLSWFWPMRRLKAEG